MSVASQEGGLGAPLRHVIDWQDQDFTDPEKIDAELRRVFDICHGCRRCFNLCDSFPRLFDLIDESESGELDTVDSKDFKPVIDACTLCDMCFMTKCPYVPPHEFDLDFPHLMLRVRVAEFQKGEVGFWDKKLADTDGNGKLATKVAGLANWGSSRKNALTRPILEKVCDIHRDAALPKYASKTLDQQVRSETLKVNTEAPAFGQKAVIYATCFSNFNTPEIGEATRKILAKNGVETEVVYPACCGMPLMEQGDMAEVTKRAKEVAAAMKPHIAQGKKVIALVPSCALMLKFEWPLIVPGDPDVKALAEATRDASEYIVEIAKEFGLAGDLKPVDGPVTLHIACHARAQNMGAKAAEMLRLIPDTEVKVVERCSGHGGSWGIKKENFEVGMKIGKPVMRQAAKNDPEGKGWIASECPLAALHVQQGVEMLEGHDAPAPRQTHPVELMARACGV
jgi:glycerol-3-phosphate dehydrogenase subunit C